MQLRACPPALHRMISNAQSSCASGSLKQPKRSASPRSRREPEDFRGSSFSPIRMDHVAPHQPLFGLFFAERAGAWTATPGEFLKLRLLFGSEKVFEPDQQ